MKKFLKKRLILVGVLLVCAFVFYKRNYEVPVLMYHHVGDPADKSGLNVSAQTFERQMEFLKVHRYNVMSLSYLVELIKTGRKIPPRTVVITFDDGHLDNFKHAFPVLKKMKFPAAIFVITDNLNKEGWLSDEDLRILHESNIAIGSHTVNHAFLPNLAREDILSELRESKRKLEKVLFYPVTLFSYPAGGYTQEAAALIESEGYAGAVTTNYGKEKHKPYGLHRIKVTEGRGRLFGFWVKVSGLYHLGKKRIEVK